MTMSITRPSNCNILLSHTHTHILPGLGCQRSTHGRLRPDGGVKKLLLFYSYVYIMKYLILQPFYLGLFILTFMATKKIKIRREILLIFRIKTNHLMYFLNQKISHSKSNHRIAISEYAAIKRSAPIKKPQRCFFFFFFLFWTVLFVLFEWQSVLMEPILCGESSNCSWHVVQLLPSWKQN